MGQIPVREEILINILGLKLKPILKRMGFCFSPYALRLTVSEMAQNRLEECLQIVVTGTHPRTIKR